MSTLPFDYLFKIVILGDSGVGKTNILSKFIENKTINAHIPTVGINYKIKIVNLESKIIKLQIWDSAGLQKFRTLSKSYYKSIQGVIFVYDIGNEESFQRLKIWMKQIDLYSNRLVSKALVGNKCDIQTRKITVEQGEKLADEYGMFFFESSAKLGKKINEIFTIITREIIRVHENKDNSTTINLSNKNTKDENNNIGCCA